MQCQRLTNGPGRFPEPKPKVMKTLSNSEFAQLIANRFPYLSKYDDKHVVYGNDGNGVIFAQETKTGYSSVCINGKRYTQMNATEKMAAVDFVNNIQVEIVTTKSDVIKDWLCKQYFVAGAYMEYLDSQKKYWWYQKKVNEIVSIEKYNA